MWSIANEADAADSYPQAVAANDIIGADSTAMESVELEFAINDQNILLLCYGDLPLADEPLAVLEISHKELLALSRLRRTYWPGRNRKTECAPTRLQTRAANGR